MKQKAKAKPPLIPEESTVFNAYTSAIKRSEKLNPLLFSLSLSLSYFILFIHLTVPIKPKTQPHTKTGTIRANYGRKRE